MPLSPQLPQSLWQWGTWLASYLGADAIWPANLDLHPRKVSRTISFLLSTGHLWIHNLRWSERFTSSEAAEKDRNFQSAGVKHLSCSNALENSSDPDCIYCVLKYSENSSPAELSPSPTARVCYSKVFLSLPSPARQLLALTCLFQNVPKGLLPEAGACFSSPCTAPGEIPPQTAMINAYMISFLSKNCSFWFPNRQQKKDGASCSPARGTEGADLVSLRQSHNQEGEYEIGWLTLHKHFIHALQSPLPSS